MRAVDRLKYRHGWKALLSLQSNIQYISPGELISGEELKSELNLMKLCALEVHIVNYSHKNKGYDDYQVAKDIAPDGDTARDILEGILSDEVERKFGKEAAKEYSSRQDGLQSLFKWAKKHDRMLCINMTYPTDKILGSYTAFIRKI